MSRIKSTLIAWALIVFTTIPSTWHSVGNNSISWDVFGYYLYLPALFIYHDIGLQDKEWLEEVKTTYEPSNSFYQFFEQPNGNQVIQYSSGQAVLYLPFFGVAHAIALVSDYPADGFSHPYELLLNVGMLSYFALGLWWLILVGRRFFKDHWVAIGLLCMYFGTNLFQIAAEYVVSPHIGLFMLYSALIYVSDSYSRRRKPVHALFIGILCGLILLNRPTEIVAIFIPLLWGYGNQTVPGWKIALKNPSDLLVSIGTAVLIGFTQLAYWKYTAGSWIHFSYENPAEGLDWLQPHTIDFLFSFRKGWFVYTPIAFFIVAGFILMKNRISQAWLPSLLVFVLSIYLMSTWTTWFYAGGSYSSRTMVNIYPVLFLPLTLAIKASLESRAKWIIGLIMISLVTLNLFQFWQWRNRIIDKTRMTAAYYQRIFLATETQPEWEKDLLVYRATTAHQNFSHPEWYAVSETTNLKFGEERQDTLLGPERLPAMRMDSQTPFTTAWSAAFSKITNKDHAWIRISADIWIPDTYDGEIPPMIVVHSEHKEKTYKYRTFHPDNWSLRRGQWQTFTYHYLTPPVRSKADRIKTYVWHSAASPVYVGEMKIEILERKE